MKKFVLCLACMISVANGFSQNEKKNPITKPSNHLLYKCNLMEFFAEKTIYNTPNDPNFFIKFLIKNSSNTTIGVDLTNAAKVVYPNQWGFYRKSYREIVDEEQIIPDKLIDTLELVSKFKTNKLTIIKPGESLAYFKNFNGNGEILESQNKTDFLIISFDGQLIFTNGRNVEHLTLNNTEETKRTIVLQNPINKKNIPEKVIIIN